MQEEQRKELLLPAEVTYALRKLRAAGYEAYLVGGCVRDFLRGVAPQDFDMTTSALPEEVHAVFCGERLIDTGIKHGTVTLLLDGLPIEITTYRVDGNYLDARHPTEVRFTASLREDVARRDFTVNAIAYHPDEGFRDFFGGCVDVENRIIRAVGDPLRRFEEDALRILRALRFSATLGFTIEESTAKATLARANLLPQISGERVREELVKLLHGKQSGEVLSVYAAVLAPLFPHWYQALNLAYDGTRVLRILDFLPDLPKDTALLFALFLYPLFLQDGNLTRASELLDSLRFDKKTYLRILKFLQHIEDPCTGDTSTLRRFVAGVGAQDAPLLLALQTVLARWQGNAARCKALEASASEIAAICASSPVCSVADLAISGRDLLALGLKPGRPIGEALETLLAAVLDGKVANTQDALLDFCTKHILHTVV